ncbi:MAG: TIGR03905 family TSCPD domain-containing protein [Bacteroidales bacterium]|nr:TIGR03905 family TSCPD domain-containing protein [Bacteroidales bacterium]
MKFQYRTQGTCSEMIEFEIVEGKLHNVQFYSGCHGNLQGIGKLVEGMDATEVISKLSGIRCGYKDTSCPDQLSKAIGSALKKVQ